jgi:hypothetical protein
MDYDLWLRIACRYPFAHRLDRILSFYRFYETNKTGGDWAPIFREASRVFARHANLASGAERRLAFVMPFVSDQALLGTILARVARQSFTDIEVLLIDPDPGQREAAIRQGSVRQMAERYDLRVRYHRGRPGGNFVSDLNSGIGAACAPIVVVFRLGCEISEGLALAASNTFMTDSVGLALLSEPPVVSNTSEGVAAQAGRRLAVEMLCGLRDLPTAFIVRKVAFLEAGGLTLDRSEPLAILELFLRVASGSWDIAFTEGQAIPSEGTSLPPVVPQRLLPYVVAAMLSELQQWYERDPFAKVRARHGQILLPPPDLVSDARRLLMLAPPGWTRYEDLNEPSRLAEIVRCYPGFAPAWHDLAEQLRANGEAQRAVEAERQFRVTDLEQRRLLDLTKVAAIS